MAYTYRNKNTGDTVERKKPDPRLDFLSNWERLDGDADSGPEDLATERERLIARLAEIDSLLAVQEAEQPPVQDPKTGPERPAVRDGKDDWLAYADQIDPGTDHSSMTKQELVDAFGEH